MYRVLCDGSPIYDLRSDDLVLLSPKLTLQDSNAGSFDFTITSKHPKYDDIYKMSSTIQVYQDDEEIFSGRVTEEKEDFYKRKTCHCEGELAYLNDTIQSPCKYQDQTIRGFLNALLINHNNKVSSDKQFQVGIVTVTDPNDSIYRYTNFETTLTCINDKLVKSLGGHLRVRKESGVRYLDYLEDSPRTNTQVIKFGENLLDFTKNFDMNDLATVIIPLGAKLDEAAIEGLDSYTTIESVNNGSLYLKSDTAVSKYGWIEKVVKWDDVNVPQNLKNKCQLYLNDIQFENMVLEIKAIDLHNMDVDVEGIHVLDTIRAVSEVHGMDRYFPITKLVISLDRPGQSTFTLGTEVRQSLTSSSNQSNSDILKKIETIPQKSEIMKEAIANATQLIHNALNGHVVTTADEQLIMDTDDKETAKKVWRWNLNGLGYSGNGYDGDYETAITMDGGIVGKFIVAGSIYADKIDINYRNDVEHKIELAEDNANDATDTKLKSYYTKSQIETTINNTKDSILLSAKETATAYTDSKLKNYSTSAQIKVTTDSITNEVNRKVNNEDWSTKIQQSAYDIKIAWNNISKYIQFTNGELQIYDTAYTSNQKLRSKFNSDGSHFYRDGYYVGCIGTNQWNLNSSHKGLVFDLEPEGKYMAFCERSSTSSSSYDSMLCFSRANSIYTQYGVHLGCDFYGHLHTINNFLLQNCYGQYNGSNYTGMTGEIPVINTFTSDGSTSSWSYSKIRVANGLIVGYWN